jgi:aldose 1-epimerase
MHRGELVAKLPRAKSFAGIISGKASSLLVIENEQVAAAITTYGARLVGLSFQDNCGAATDVVVGLPSLDAYLHAREPFLGPIVGRVANRIAQGRFVLDGVVYHMEKNEGQNTLHSGPSGFHAQVWNLRALSRSSLELAYLSRDGEGGFPGKALRPGQTFRSKTVYALSQRQRHRY